MASTTQKGYEGRTSYTPTEAVTDAVEHPPASRDEIRDQNLKYEATGFALKNDNGILTDKEATRYVLGIGTEDRLSLDDTNELRRLLAEGDLTGDKGQRFTHLMNETAVESRRLMEDTEISPETLDNAHHRVQTAIHYLKVEHVAEYREQAKELELNLFTIKAIEGTATREDALEILQDTKNHLRLDGEERERLQTLSDQQTFTREEQLEFLGLTDKSYQGFRAEAQAIAGENWDTVDTLLRETLMEEAVRCSPDPAVHAKVYLPGEYRFTVSEHVDNVLSEYRHSSEEGAHFIYADTAYRLAQDLYDYKQTGELPDWVTEDMALTDEQRAMGHTPFFKPLIYEDPDDTTQNIRNAVERYKRDNGTEDASQIYDLALMQFRDGELEGNLRAHDRGEALVLEYIRGDTTVPEAHGDLHYAQQLTDFRELLKAGEGEHLELYGRQMLEDAQFIRDATEADRTDPPQANVEGYSAVFDTTTIDPGSHWSQLAVMTGEFTDHTALQEAVQANLEALTAHNEAHRVDSLETAEARALDRAQEQMETAVTFMTEIQTGEYINGGNSVEGHYSAVMHLMAHADWLLRHGSQEELEEEEDEEENEKKGLFGKIKDGLVQRMRGNQGNQGTPTDSAGNPGGPQG